MIGEDANEQYMKKPSARERQTLCPICYNNITTHFSRHLFRHYPNDAEVKNIVNLKLKSKERKDKIKMLRKRGYFCLNVEKNILNPVRKSMNPNTEYFVCRFCLGHYSKHLFHKHVKKCTSKPKNINNPGKHCLTESQTFLAGVLHKNSEFFQSSRMRKEVFPIMLPDKISPVAKTDSLICLYGESLLNRHKRQQITKMVSNKIREMGLLLAIKTFQKCEGLFDILRPEMFSKLIYATKLISVYEE
ncbi:hypothetical protein ABEB36_014473 [Hypothenemus hampei]|uniref:Uncharacterized protein n=1 Tax=Hypothenemus hampei TaxID=57062 RepID=A0ABD1E1Y2_HYPHA